VATTPVIPDFSGGGVLTVTAAQQLSSALSWLFNRPAFRGRGTVATLLTSSVWSSVGIDLEDLDNDPSGTGGHSTSVNTSRFTSVYSGWYVGMGGPGFAASATAGRRGARWAVNGTALRGSAAIFNTSTTLAVALASRCILAFLGVGDYLESQAFFEGGGTLNTGVGDFTESSFDVFFLRNA
jgi:hypothetical protein